VSETELKGQAQRGAERRQAILDATLEVFASRGYRSGALGEIAARVDVTPAAILYHFGSKEDLLMAVIAERDRRAAAALSRLPPGGGLPSIRALLSVAKAMERERGLAALHTVLQAENLEPDGPAHAYFLGRSRFACQWVTQLLREGQDRGEVRADVSCPAKARELIAFLEGAAMLWLLDDEISLAELYGTYLDAFVRSVEA
jgi:AcrR family transcriptional regulator